MLQVVQYQKNGEVLIEEMPAPSCLEGGILVRTVNSLISAGTEKISVTNTQGSLLQRAKKQPEQVKLVMDAFKKEGFKSTLQKVQSKLDSFKTIGYSASGVVVESLCDEFKPGDRVACAGAGYAVHGEIISVPKNLAAMLPENVSFEEAAYTTLGSIAMQGVRQADLRLGENVAVIGLGLLGQITVQLLAASGCRVAAMDINEGLFDRAKQNGAGLTLPSSKEYIKDMTAFTGGVGFDAVILTASTSSNEPLEIGLQIARKRGKVVVVGAVGLNVPRSPFYEKEIDIKIACSYGPGRYDINYEEYGNDYPVAYVRWTENRNMQAFLELISSGRMDVKSMTTHNFALTDAVKAYDMITGKANDPYLGILINYPEREGQLNKSIKLSAQLKPVDKIGLGFIGAGTFGQSYLLPPLQESGVEMIAVSTSTSVNALSAAKKFGFKTGTTDSLELINNPEVNLVFCATRHDTHALYVLQSIKAGKPVFVEKPLAATAEELQMIDDAVAKYNGNVMVGFNRRFSKSFGLIHDFFAGRTEPMSILYRVNAGKLPANYWAYLPEQGGGRIVGEVCHFIDCMVYLTGAVPVRVFAEAISTGDSSVRDQDNVIINIKFSDGSIGAVHYLANGDAALPKEYCEVFCQGSIAVMNNFTSVELIKSGKTKKLTLDGKKGHREEVLAVVKAVKEGKPLPIPYNETSAITHATFAAMESLRTGLVVTF